ncbi:hypothetical protein RhiirC2_776199 [Rhizophagus irregularis]|uniref:Uncharacterized protein n=1 Tax=Rhizophagus irregularis TaxID=588596 RepID=A0A2N1NHI6_9GLOM|nr:hypothetical protein RhiirC2_776199 [Rhizophagus irregularis]
MNSTTKEALNRFQNILKRLLDIQKTNEENIEYNKNFDAKTIKKEILAEFEHGCKGPSHYIVILEPADNPNSDQAILEAVNMYRADFNLQENGYLDIVADEVIFRRLMRCQAQFFQLRPLLGQWHTSKDFYKFEAAVDYRTTSRVLDLLWLAIGVADALSAASPLFPSAGKSNYVLVIAQHLFTLTKYPRLNEILQYVGAFRILKNNDNKNEDQKPVCFDFDEVLETFGIHFVKQNITGNIIDEAKLKKGDLVIIFDMIDPLSHEIFKDLESLELYKEGRHALKIWRTRHKDYAEKKRTEKEVRRRQKHDKEVFQLEPQVDNQESKK